MLSSPAPRWSDRLAHALRGAVLRMLGVGLTGRGSGGGSAVGSRYPVERSMRALARNPWVYACVQAKCTDLSSLPLVAETGRGNLRSQTAQHPILDLLDQPSPKVSGRRFRRQSIADYSLSGNAPSRVWFAGDKPIQLGRFAPGAVFPIVAADGEVVGWKTPQRTMSWREVLHIADVSWEPTEQLVWGQSPIEPLATGLQVDYDARKQAGRTAKRGILSMLLTPADSMMAISDENVAQMADSFAASMERGDGIYVAPRAMTATPTSLTAKDGEFMGERDRNKSEVLAVMGVPPVRAGDPVANYGTAKQQMRTYWESLQGIAALFDDEYSRLAEPGVRVRHSFAGVEALQTSHTERQARAAVWVGSFGMDPALAARYEGFLDVPLEEGSGAPGATSTPAPGADEPRETLSAEGRVTAVLHFAAAAYREVHPDAGPASAEEAVRMSLRLSLASMGVERQRAADVAEESAAVLCAVAQHEQEADLLELPAFQQQHARRILSLAGVSHGR